MRSLVTRYERIIQEWSRCRLYIVVHRWSRLWSPCLFSDRSIVLLACSGHWSLRNGGLWSVLQSKNLKAVQTAAC